MPEKVSMADVARKAGVSQATVSRALGNDPRISARQRLRIQRLSEQMGYRPNPLVKALMASRRSPRPRSGTDTIAFITNYGAARDWAFKPTCVVTFEGILKRAGELGFNVEIFSVQEHGGQRGRVERVLRARGIRGVIVGFSNHAPEPLSLSLDGLAVVGLEAYFPNLQVDRAQVHGFHNIKLALQRLRELGYVRTGLVVPRYNNGLVGNSWSAAYLDDQWFLPKGRRCEPFLPDDDNPDTKAFGSWIGRQRPDSLIVYKVDAPGMLEELGLRVPRDLAVAFLYRTEAEIRNAAGVDENMIQLGAATVDLLAERLHTNRFGAPETVKEVLIKGFWRDGPTAPRSRPGGSRTTGFRSSRKGG